MDKNVIITNGTGNIDLINGNYSVSAEVTGYDNSSINPSSVNVVEGTNTYNFTIAATGTLTLHVTENGEASGTPIVGATFVRTDSEGNEYGSVITTDASGNAVLSNVPFAASNAPEIYFKQLSSDGNHEFDDSVQNTSMNSSTVTVQIENEPGEDRTINLTDANYDNLPIDSGTLTFTK